MLIGVSLIYQLPAPAVSVGEDPGSQALAGPIVGSKVRESAMKPVGKPDARNGHVRFDERGRETGRRSCVSTRARPRLYLQRASARSLRAGHSRFF